MIVSCRATSAAPDSQVVAEMNDVLDRRGSMKHPPVTIAVSDAVALAIAGLLSSPTPAGQVLGRFYRTGSIDSADLLEAARIEQGFASPEGHAALHCLIGWVHRRVHRLETEARR
ncbi:MAG: hypothetical protein JWR45_2816 [Blastococcus sp.]|nr:hypothetical protein [Blastococcus sp.]